MSQLRDLKGFMAPRWFVAGRTELMEEGFSSSRIRNWLRGGRLVRVIDGVYSYGRDIEMSEAAWRAALVAAGPDSVLTGRSACEAWGAIRTKRTIPALIEVGSERRKAKVHPCFSPALRRTRVKVVRRQFEPGDVRTKHGLRLERAALALIDLAVNATASDVRFAFLETCRLGLFGERDVAFCFRRVAGRRGAKKLRPLLALWVPELRRIKSVLEGLFLLAWVERGLEMPEVNVKVCGFEVDDYWSAHRLVLELDGGAFHSDPLAVRRDTVKTRKLEAAGFRVIRVSYDEFALDPAAVVKRIAAIITPARAREIPTLSAM